MEILQFDKGSATVTSFANAPLSEAYHAAKRSVVISRPDGVVSISVFTFASDTQRDIMKKVNV